jgi:hypothetical protein
MLKKRFGLEREANLGLFLERYQREFILERERVFLE